jgi:hypothetical protein
MAKVTAAKAEAARVLAEQRAARIAAVTAAKAAEAQKVVEKQAAKAAKEAVERSKPLVDAARPKVEPVVEAARPKVTAAIEAAKPVVAKGAERVLEVAQTSPNGHRRKKNEDFAGVRELRKALDDAIATGKEVPHDKPLVTRLI